MRFLCLLTWGFVLISMVTVAQTQLHLRCLTVQSNGDVILRWNIPSMNADFQEYNIFHATSANPGLFSEIVSLGAENISTYTHSGTNANDAPNYYFIKTLMLNGDSIISDTLATIYLDIDDPGDGNLVLSWNAPRVPLLASFAPEYDILLEYPAGSWNTIASTDNLSFEYEISTCNDLLNFRIGLGDNSGCNSYSNITGGIYQDIIPPPMPEIDSVSIDASTGKAVIGWEKSPAEDAAGYYVYRNISGNYILIDTVRGINTTFYEDLTSQPCTKTESYAMAAFDSCGNRGLGTFLTPQQTILSNTVYYEPCAKTHSISWTPYINMDPPVSGYKIYESRDGGPFVEAGITGPSQTSFTTGTLNTGVNYTYFIRAYNESGFSSSSCTISSYAYQYKLPEFNYLANATVEDNDHVDIKIHVDAAAVINQCKIFRYSENSGTWEEIYEFTEPGENILSYQDFNVSVSSEYYIYQTLLTDSCGNEFIVSNNLNTMLLQAERLNNDLLKLEWNLLEGWDGGVAAYHVYRITDDVINTDPIAVLENDEREYIDDLSSLSSEGSTFGYVVSAIEANGNIYGFKEQSYSNEIQIQENPKIFLPNAFRPGGLNNIYKPKGVFINFANYQFRIYNRWGKLLFETYSFNDGWDGKYNGKKAPMGVYVYHLIYQSPEGFSDEKKGTFVLIR